MTKRFQLWEEHNGKTDRWMVRDTMSNNRIIKSKMQKADAVDMFNELNGIKRPPAPTTVVKHEVKVPMFARAKQWFKALGHRLWVRFPFIRKLWGKS